MESNGVPPVTVLGAGPSGLAIAHECARRGLRVALRAPDPFAPWPASYGTFEEQLPHPYVSTIAHRYPCPLWIDRRGARRELRSPYVRLSTPGLQGLLLEKCREAGVQFIPRAEPTAGELEGLCIAATGRAPDALSSTRYQSAYGVWTRLSHEWLRPGEMIFMDLSGPDVGGPPSFLYATRDGELHFLQETVLVSSRRVGFEELERRLKARLAAHGLPLGDVSREEHCLIAMGGPARPGRGNMIHFGAQAGFTQPASGYSLAHSLRLAASLAQTLAARRGGSPIQIAERARRHLWTWERRARFQLFNYGASVLGDLDQAQLARFMDTFLTMPPAAVSAFVDGGLSLSGTLKLMSKTFNHSEAQLRARLLRLGTKAPRTFASS